MTTTHVYKAGQPLKFRIWDHPSADLFLTTLRRMPTANAEALDRVGGRHRRGPDETRRQVPFRSARVLGCSPSACSEVLKKKERARPLSLGVRPPARPSAEGGTAEHISYGILVMAY